MSPSLPRHAALLCASLFGVAVSACPRNETDGPLPPSCKYAFAGDKSRAPGIELLYWADGVTHPVTEGGEVPLLLPLQGGRVIYVGARVTNLDPCGAVITGSIRDLDNNQIRLDARTINFTPQSDGWAETTASDLSSFANIPACPNEWSGKSIFDATYTLELKVRDRGGRTVSMQAGVRPSCAEPAVEAECRCICKTGYKLGEQCQGTGGAGSTSSGSASASSGQ